MNMRWTLRAPQKDRLVLIRVRRIQTHHEVTDGSAGDRIKYGGSEIDRNQRKTDDGGKEGSKTLTYVST